MAQIPVSRTSPQASEIAVQTATPMVGSASREDLQTTLNLVDAELAKLFEDRNIALVDGGIITLVSAGTSVTFTQNLRLHVNSKVVGGAPIIIDLGATTRAVSANLRMIYATIDREAGTAVVTADAATLPTVTAANQEVILIAKRVDSSDGVVRIYFRGGFSLSRGQSSRLGTSGGNYASEFSVMDDTDTTKRIEMQASGSSTATTLTLSSPITANRTVTFPDATTTLVGTDVAQTLTAKTFGDAITGTQIVTPSTPSSGFSKIYPKSDGNFYQLTPGGTESQLGGFLTESFNVNNLALTASVSANALTVALKTNAGADPSAADPVKINFRNATATNGTYVERSITSAKSVVVPSGTTIGTISGAPAYIYVYAIDNAGTVELALSTSTILDEGSLQSSSAISGGSFPGTLYSTSAIASKAVRLIGRIATQQTTAGTWATSPSELSVLPFDKTLYSDNKNYIINGDMYIAQRLTYFGVTSVSIGNPLTSSSGSFMTRFACDRWMCFRATDLPANSSTASRQSAGLKGFTYCLRYQRNNGNTSTNTMHIVQNIETVVFVPIQGKTVTLSFYARRGANFSGSGNNISVRFYTGTGTDESVRVGFTGQLNPLNQTISLSTSWQKFEFTFSLSQLATEGALVFQYTPVGTAGVSDYFDITGVMLQEGTKSTDFVLASGSNASLMGELTLCRRYCEIIGPGMVGTAEATTTAGMQQAFLVPKRNVPIGIIASQFSIRHSLTDFTAASPTFANFTAVPTGLWTQILGFTGLTVNGLTYYRAFQQGFAYAESEII